MTTITGDLIQQGASDVGGWTHRQFKLLGLNPNPPQGWKRRIIGTQIPTKDAEEFLRLRNTSKAMQRRLNGSEHNDANVSPKQKSLKHRLRQAESDAAYYKRRYEELLAEMQESRLDAELREITS